MLKVENLETWGFEHAIRGMRNPMNSWDKSDSRPVRVNVYGSDESIYPLGFALGKKDLDLMRRLYNAGPEHRKYLRQIFVSLDITAPLYWWKEFDTYKIGTVSNSCSTMHKIAAKEFELNDFSHEHLTEGNREGFGLILNCLNTARQNYLETKDKLWWWQMIQTLPSSYNQKRTITMNYENAVTIIKQRTGHKLDEWKTLIDELKTLPYIERIIEDGN